MSIIILLFWLSIAIPQVAVIAHESVPVDKITDTELLDFYTGDVRLWNDGKPVVVFDLKPKGEVKDIFYKFLGKSSSRMKSIWMKNMLSGEGDPPPAIQSEKDMLKKVSSTPGAIGFISSDSVTEKVKVLVEINIED